MDRPIPAVLSAGLLALAAPAAFAQASDEALRQEIEALKQGQQQIRQDLAEINRLLQQQKPAPPPSGSNVEGKVFDVGDNPVKGEPTAKLTLIEFTDYQCGYCARHARETYPQIAKAYVDSGKLRYAALDLPLERIHKLAFKAAEASHCAEEQGKYWQMHDRLFQHQRALEPWSGHAEALGLDVARFDECMASGRHADAVRKDMGVARSAGATGTPSFVLGYTDLDDPTKVEGITFLKGAQAYGSFKAAIDEALPGEPVRPAAAPE